MSPMEGFQPHEEFNPGGGWAGGSGQSKKDSPKSADDPKPLFGRHPSVRIKEFGKAYGAAAIEGGMKKKEAIKATKEAAGGKWVHKNDIIHSAKNLADRKDFSFIPEKILKEHKGNKEQLRKEWLGKAYKWTGSSQFKKYEKYDNK